MKIKKLISKLGKKILRSLSLMLYYCNIKKRNNNSIEFESLRNVYKGKRIFIVCTGPSLTAGDLDKIKENGDYSFGCNKIDAIFSRTEWRPDFYTVIDETYQFTLLSNMKKIPAKVKFFGENSYIATRKAGGKVIWMNTDGDRGLLDNPKFSEDASKIVYTIGTVTYAMLQLSVYLGFRDIYIIGCDNSYAKNISRDGKITETGRMSHFQGSEKNTNEIPISIWEMEAGYNYARKYADANGIHIYNATRGGYLEAFERVDFDSLFK